MKYGANGYLITFCPLLMLQKNVSERAVFHRSILVKKFITDMHSESNANATQEWELDTKMWYSINLGTNTRRQKSCSGSLPHLHSSSTA